MWPRVVLLLAAAFLAGCTKLRAQAASGAPDAGSAASAPASPARTVVPMAGEREIHVTKLLSTGEVLAASAYILFRFPAEAGATVREIPMLAGHTVDRLAVARAADVAFAWTDDGALYRLRGTTLEPFATNVRVASVSDAGNVVEARLRDGVIAYLDGASGKELRRLQATDQKHDVLGYEARLSPDGRWAFANGAILATDGARPDVPTGKADGVAWLGTTALLFDTGAVLFTDPAARTTRRVPVCDGVMRFDRVVPRVVVACAKQVDVVALPGGEKVSIPVPAAPGHTPENVEPARDGLTLHGRWGPPTENYLGRSFVIDPVTRTAKPDPSSPPLRGWSGEPAEAGATIADCRGCGTSPARGAWT